MGQEWVRAPITICAESNRFRHRQNRQEKVKQSVRLRWTWSARSRVRPCCHPAVVRHCSVTP
jgi:hypothetical protein